MGDSLSYLDNLLFVAKGSFFLIFAIHMYNVLPFI